MKFTLLLVLISNFANATSYYFSTQFGDDNRTSSQAQNSSTPWKSIKKLNVFTGLKPGDSILFNRGESFYGSLKINSSGVLGKVIFYGSYGTGYDPVITGFTTVKSWTNLGGSIWESEIAVSTLSTCNIVVIDGVNTAMGRYPNTGYLTFQSHFAKTTITTSQLNSAVTQWIGAELVIRSSNWTLDRTIITGHFGTTLTYNRGVSYEPINGFGYFIQNDSRTLDTTNEWYYNPSTKKIRIYSKTAPTNVQIPNEDVLITIHGAYLTFNGLTFTGANSNTFYNNWSGFCSNIIIQNCRILFSGIDAIRLTYTPNIKIENCTILNSNNNAINLLFGTDPYAVITGNVIKNTGICPGMGQNGNGSYSGINSADKGLKVENNKIINTGYSAIRFSNDSVLIKNNLIDTFCTILQDGGGIYTWNNLTNAPKYTDRKVQNNIVLNGIGAAKGTNNIQLLAEGIYMDAGTQDVEIAGNTIANCANGGIFIHDGHEIAIRFNTVYNNLRQLYFAQDEVVNRVQNNIIENNLFIARGSNQSTLFYLNSLAYPITSLGSVNNNYYARPIDDNSTINIINRLPFYSTANYSLAGWQSFSGLDSNSKSSPKTIANVIDLRFEYNATPSNKTVILDKNYIDMKGNIYLGTITLAPYSSAVLIR